MMVIHRETGRIEHRVFRELPVFLRPNDCLVINGTQVVPARFTARRRTGGQIGGLFVREHSPGRWTVLLAGGGRLKDGEPLRLGDSPWTMTLIRREGRGHCEVQVTPTDAAAVVLESVGSAPLPPYIRRGKTDSPERIAGDLRDYQTVYASHPGAVAAPTAGMHFTRELLHRIRRDVGASVAEVVLHVGLGTFLPVEVQDLADHAMHSEWYNLTPDNAAMIQEARARGGRIVAVGTTSVRVLETCCPDGIPHAGSGWTDILIYPPYTFKAVDVLLTNFHLPCSTLLALVCAFAGREMILRAYQSATAEQYRFYSYGDAMLIL